MKYRLAAWQKIICEIRKKGHFYKNFVEVILISEFMDSEIRISSAFMPFCQAARI